jgi:hypothetical protein
MPRSRKCGRESSSHWRAAASQLVTFTSWRGRDPGWASRVANLGDYETIKLGLQLDPKIHSRPRHPLRVVGKKALPCRRHPCLLGLCNLTPLASRLAAVPPPLRAIRARARCVDQIVKRGPPPLVHRPFLGYPQPSPLNCLNQVGIVFSYSSRVPFYSTLPNFIGIDSTLIYVLKPTLAYLPSIVFAP